jgi:hypothetical protein
MTIGHVVYVEVELAPSDQGGLKAPMASGTRSLLLQFQADEGQPISLGAELAVEGGGELVPGAKAMQVLARFWADEARSVALPPQSFVLWYGREVGRGRVLQVIDDHS